MAGLVPGIPIGRRFYSRCEVAAVGLHHHWLSGISYVPDKEARKAGVADGAFAVSIIVSGGYEDDQDDGSELTYTGQGGNDLLGKKRQTAHQTWDRGNAALRTNARLRIPVRVTRGAWLRCGARLCASIASTAADADARIGGAAQATRTPRRCTARRVAARAGLRSLHASFCHGALTRAASALQVFIFDGLYDVLSADETVGVSGCVSALSGWLPCPHPKRRHIKARRTASTAGGTKLAPQRLRDAFYSSAALQSRRRVTLGSHIPRPASASASGIPP